MQYINAHRQWHCGSGSVGLIAPPRRKLELLEVGKCSSSKNFSPKMQNLGLETPIWGNLGAKLKFWAPIISSVGNFQLSVKQLQRSCPAYFFKPRQCCSQILVTGKNEIDCIQQRPSVFCYLLPSWRNKVYIKTEWQHDTAVSSTKINTQMLHYILHINLCILSWYTEQYTGITRVVKINASKRTLRN